MFALLDGPVALILQISRFPNEMRQCCCRYRKSNTDQRDHKAQKQYSWMIHTNQPEQHISHQEHHSIRYRQKGNTSHVLCIFRSKCMILFNISKYLPRQIQSPKARNRQNPQKDDPRSEAIGKFWIALHQPLSCQWQHTSCQSQSTDRCK